jgi:hypothetical protein
MARDNASAFQGSPARPVATAGTDTPANRPVPSPLGGTIEKGFSSTPTANDAIALTPAEVSAPASGSGTGGTTVTSIPPALLKKVST